MRIAMRKYILSFVLISFTATAQSNIPLNTTTSSLEYQWLRLKENLAVNYKNLSGFSVQKEIESEFEGKIDYDEPPTGRMVNELAIGYKLSNDTIASVVGVWSVRPGNDESEGGNLEALDPYLKLAFEGVIERGNFEYSSDLRIGAPVSRESKAGDRIVTIGSEQEFEYQFGKSRFSSELEIYIQYNAHEGQSKYDDFEFRYEPAMLYQISNRTYGRLAYESKMRQERHDKLTIIDNREPAAQIGVGWQINKQLELFPFMDVNLKEPGTKNALYGALVSWAIL